MHILTLIPRSVGILGSFVILCCCTGPETRHSWSEDSYQVHREPGPDRFSARHYPSVRIDGRRLAVRIALEAEGDHRIEEVRVFQGDLELTRLDLETDEEGSRAGWIIPPEIEGTLRVIARCNRHLLFETRVPIAAMDQPADN